MRRNAFLDTIAAAIALTLCWAAGGASYAQTSRAPEQVVREHAQAWSDGDVQGLLALFADDGRSYDRSIDPHRLGGELSRTIGGKPQLATYFRALAAKPPLAREEITAMAVVGDLVIAAGESARPPSFATRMRFLTAYRVRDGQIRDLWHIAWLPAEQPARPDPADAIRQLIAANNARDADRFIALFSPDAKHFRYSADPRRLADQPSKTVVDAASRDRTYRKYFAAQPLRVEAVALFSVGDLVVEQSQVSGFADAPGKVVNEVSIYRIRDGRIVDDWLLAEAVQVAATGAGR